MARAPKRPKTPDEQRRELFRRMERTFVWGPPIALVVLTVLSSTAIAFLAPVRGTTFWQRFAIVVFIVFVVPLVGYLIRARRGDRDES